MIGASIDDIVPVVNATAGICAVLDSFPLSEGDLVLVTSISYAAVSLVLIAQMQTSPVHRVFDCLFRSSYRVWSMESRPYLGLAE